MIVHTSTQNILSVQTEVLNSTCPSKKVRTKSNKNKSYIYIYIYKGPTKI